MGRTSFFVLFAAFGILTPAIASAPQTALKSFAKVGIAEANEVSGIVKSQRRKNLFWIHNDSGDSARLFAMDDAGKRIGLETGVKIEGAKNVDWEDIAIDGSTLYISDLGNNGNARQDLAIYEVPEPDPSRATASVSKKILIKYPDQSEFPPPVKRRFDSEAIFVLNGKVFILSKDRISGFMPDITASLYRLDTMHGDKVNVPVKVDSAKDLGGWVTAADVSPDGKTLAVLVHLPQPSVWLFPTQVSNDKILSSGKGRQIKITGVKQVEALCFESDRSVIITNETGEIYRLKI